MSTTIRVLHLAGVINRYDFIDNVLRHCDRGRFRLYACTFSGASNIQPPDYADVPHAVLGVRSRQAYPRAVARLARLLRRERIDIVHTHHFDPTAVGIAAAGLAGRRVVVGRHYSDALHRLPTPWKRGAYLRAEALVHRLAARIVVPSERVYALLTRTQHVDAGKVVRIPYGFDFEKYVPSPEGAARARRAYAPRGETLIACVGRLHREKGQVFLLRAARSLLTTHPNVRVLLVGDGPERPALEAAARDLGLGGRVVFAGWRSDVVDLLAAADVVVQPSLTETFSQTMVEALALGKPLVMTDVSGAREAVRDGETGALVSPADADAIAAALRGLLDAPERAQRLGEAGRAHVRATFDIRAVVRRYESCYETVYEEAHAA